MMTKEEVQSFRPTIQVCPGSAEASHAVAELMAETIRQTPSCVLGLATGGTPMQTYRELVRAHQTARLDFSGVTTFNLDEYVGLGGEHPQSYRYFMQQQLFDHVNVDPQRTHVPNGMAADLAAHAVEYERLIAEAGGIDLQLLGIGHNGHIAFNEPGASRDSRTRVVPLTEQTIEKNARFFDSAEQVPRTAITMGIGTILEAKRIVMLATGRGKAEAIRLAVEGEIDESHPASLLRLHPAVTIVLDRDAASGMECRG